MPHSGERLNREQDALHPSKVDPAQRTPGTSTEADVIEQRLDGVAFAERLHAGVDAMRGKHLRDIFAEEHG